MIDESTPIYLQGQMAPVPDEIESFDLPVSGSIPPELNGRYVRNGPNPRAGEDPGHWFAGRGMLHGIRIRGGRAEWYRNRWVRTPNFSGEPTEPAGTPGQPAFSANTSIVRHSGRTLALEEGGLPHLIDDELGTLGVCDFDGRLATAMTAHPKLDPVTGELHFFGYSVMPPYLTYHRVNAAGELVETRVIDVPGPTMMHDFAITANHVIWLDLPAVVDLSTEGSIPIRFDESYGARIGVMPHGRPVRWFDIDPGYVFHVGNAAEDPQGRIVLDAARYSPASFAAIWGQVSGGTAGVEEAADAAVERLGAYLHRWVLDPVTGTSQERQLDDRPVEFPTIRSDRTGLAARYLYAVDDKAIHKYDLRTDSTATHVLPADRIPGEAVFVPAEAATAEDEGWLLSLDGDNAGTASRLLIIDATNPTAPPVATVTLPRRVPAGFHGAWLRD
ncbi:MAG: carotenoid oxygenase family protein [Stackebrandtia sp.]